MKTFVIPIKKIQKDLFSNEISLLSSQIEILPDGLLILSIHPFSIENITNISTYISLPTKDLQTLKNKYNKYVVLDPLHTYSIDFLDEQTMLDIYSFIKLNKYFTVAKMWKNLHIDRQELEQVVEILLIANGLRWSGNHLTTFDNKILTEYLHQF